MKSYPMMLQIENKQVAMIGGGSIAVRKVKRLLQSRAQVTVIAPDIDPELYRLYKENEIRWKKKTFEPTDLVGAFLIFAATNSREINEAVEYAAGPDQLVNVIDNKHGGNFHVPASMTRGQLTISVATNGASPSLARHIKNELAERYNEEHVRYLEFLDDIRHYVTKKLELNSNEKNAILSEVTKAKYIDLQEQQIFYNELSQIS